MKSIQCLLLSACILLLSACGTKVTRDTDLSGIPRGPVAGDTTPTKSSVMSSDFNETANRVNAAVMGREVPSSAESGSTDNTGTVTSSQITGLLADGDEDGVIDAEDDCPDTPIGEPVRESGCGLFSGSIAGLDFPPNAYRLSSESRSSLASLVDDLNEYPNVVLSLGGHTDNRGTAPDNLELSKQRVLAVVRYLVANGIAPQRLQPYGYGESRPIASNASEAGRKQNRRIELAIVNE